MLSPLFVELNVQRGAYIDNEHDDGKRGFDHLHQEVDADRVKAEAALRILAQVHQHRLQPCIYISLYIARRSCCLYWKRRSQSSGYSHIMHLI